MKDKLLVLDCLNKSISVDNLSCFIRTLENQNPKTDSKYKEDINTRMNTNDPFSYEKHTYKNK